MYENRVYKINRKYYSILTFHDKSYWDSVESNSWELYGFIKNPSEASRLDLLNENGWAARCDLHGGRFLDLKNGLKDTNCFTTINSGGYLKNNTPISIDNQDFTICCWFRMNKYMDRYTDYDNHDITLCGWTDASGKNVSIDIYHKDYKTRLQNVTLRVYIDDEFLEGQYLIPGTMPYNGEWMFFSFQMYNGNILVHIDGNRILDVLAEDKYALGNTLKDLKLGAFKSNSSGGVDIDDFVIMNDHISYENYNLFEDHIYNVMSEILYERLAISKKNLKYYKSGLLYGLKLKTYVGSASNGILTFTGVSNLNSDMILGLFINNLYMHPSRYTVADQQIVLNEQSDIDTVSGSYIEIVMLDNDIGFKISKSSTQADNSISISLPKKGLLSKDSFLIFNGSLALIQENRYTIDSNKLTMTDPSDKLQGTVVFLYFDQLSTSSYYNTDLEMKFLYRYAIVDERGTAKFEEHEFIKFSSDSTIFFVNGTYLPTGSYILYENSIVIKDDHDIFTVNDMVIAVTIVSNEGPKVTWDLLNYINGASQYNDIISSIDIIRNKNVSENGIDLNRVKWY